MGVRANGRLKQHSKRGRARRRAQAQRRRRKAEAHTGICRHCSCTDDDCRQCVAATGFACSWVQPNLCSRCANEGKQ